MKYIYTFREAPETVYNSIGGKGCSLVKMTKLKLPVPKGYVILADAFETGKIKGAARQEIEALAHTLSTNKTYAVRSSALNEDGNNASFAGQYETITNVKANAISEAIMQVISSADSERVREYSANIERDNSNTGIAIVVQEFIEAEFAGVLFTSDALTQSADTMVCNFVKGAGEALVSGAQNAYEFRINAIRFCYEGDDAMRPYAHKLFNYASIIRNHYGVPMDIEWAVSAGKVHILQARPITTLRRANPDTYEVNGSKAGRYLLTRTNVGEIFMKPLSPMTYSILEEINKLVGIPHALDTICGQPFMNISVLCSMLISLGMPKEKAFANIRDLVGNMPSNVEIPIFPFDIKASKRQWRKLLTSRKSRTSSSSSALHTSSRKALIQNLPTLAREMIRHLQGIETNSELAKYFDSVLFPSFSSSMSAVIAQCGLKMVPLFTMRNKISQIAGPDMANRLCGGCVGTLDSMKPLLLIEDLAEGRITREEYLDICGHRSENEMELMMPRPYENPAYIDELIANYKDGGINLHESLTLQEQNFQTALAEFNKLYPHRRRFISRKIKSFAEANQFREEIRGKCVWVFCVLREFMLAAGRINGLGDDIFMLYLDEALDLVRGDNHGVCNIVKRRENYQKNLTYPNFPSLVLGKFNPDIWLADKNRRYDFVSDEIQNSHNNPKNHEGHQPDLGFGSDVNGFPGATGIVKGTARVISNLEHISELQPGEILVTCATNIGWTVAFPKAAAIVTDIGAPLSHAAIVAREFGIPAVVGCGNATTVIHTGDTIEVDGFRGTVKVITSQNGTEA